MKNTNWIIEQCLLILQRNDVKEEVKTLLSPVIELMLVQIYPYIYISLLLVVISFLLHLGIFLILLRNKYFIKYILSFILIRTGIFS